jgi:hypothetical protein
LHEDAEDLAGEVVGAVVAGDDGDVEGLGAGLDDVDRLGVALVGNEEDGRVVAVASAAAVPSSSMEALAICMPVRSVTRVWKFRSASRRPWEISAW